MKIRNYKDFLFEWGYGGEGGEASKDPIEVKDRMFTDIDLEDGEEEEEDKDIPILKDIKESNSTVNRINGIYDIEESFFLENYNLTFSNIEECRNIAMYLKSLGYDVYNYKSIMNDDYRDFACFNYCNEPGGGYYFVRFATCRRHKHILPYSEIVKFKNFKKLKKIENHDLDPFGEEEWGYENMIENNNSIIKESNVFDNLENYFILIPNLEESKGVAEILAQLGYEVYNFGGIMRESEYNKKYPFIYYDKDKKRFVRTQVNNYIRKTLRYSDIITLKNKKIKKIERPDVDPFDEEDWGYEVFENKNIDIDPFGEENWEEKISETNYLKWKESGGDIYSFLKQLNNVFINTFLSKLEDIEVRYSYSMIDDILGSLEEDEGFSEEEMSYIEKDIMELTNMCLDNEDDDEPDTDKDYDAWKDDYSQWDSQWNL